MSTLKIQFDDTTYYSREYSCENSCKQAFNRFNSFAEPFLSPSDEVYAVLCSIDDFPIAYYALPKLSIFEMLTNFVNTENYLINQKNISK